jgi:spermidine synthase
MLAMARGVYFSRDDRILEAVATPYNRVAVVSSGERVSMDVAGATFATWHPRYLMTGYSWDALAAGCLLRGDGPPATVLLLGVAGGTVARQLRTLVPDAAITGVEIDPEVLGLARRHMGLDDYRMEIVVGDAVSFLASTSRRFDAIVDDLFLSGPKDVVRPSLPPAERLELIRDRLAPGGVAVANLIVDAAGPLRTERRLTRRAFVAAFATVRVIHPVHGLNEILVGGGRPATARALRRFAPRLEKHDQRYLVGMRVDRLRRHRGLADSRTAG